MRVSSSFRPLIRGFFFYIPSTPSLNVLTCRFPSPHSGILFLLSTMRTSTASFSFPSPHSGILFLSSLHQSRINLSGFSFPSPHSGILFLSCHYDMPPSLNIFAIFRRILHLLAQKGFSLTQSIHFSPYPSASARIKSFFIHIVPSPIPLNQYIITSSSFISPMPHDLTLVWS